MILYEHFKKTTYLKPDKLDKYEISLTTVLNLSLFDVITVSVYFINVWSPAEIEMFDGG